MHSLLLWKDDKNYSGFACHLKNKQAPNLSGFIWLYRTRLKVHHAPNYGRTNSSLGHLWWVGLFVLSLCVSLLAMISEASNIFHLCIKLIKGRLLVALNDFFFFTVLDQSLVTTALGCPRQRWVFPKRTVSFRYDWPYPFT